MFLTTLYIGFNSFLFVGSDIIYQQKDAYLKFDTKVTIEKFEIPAMGFSPESIVFESEAGFRIGGYKVGSLWIGYTHKCYHVFDRKKSWFNKNDTQMGTNHRIFAEVKI